MINGKKITVIMPAFNAEKTLRKTVDEIPREYVDTIIVVDDKSTDQTVELARRLDVHLETHDKNRGYGANQKTCYRLALKIDSDVVIMLHPDYQYSPKLILAMASMICFGEYDVVLGSRIIGGGSLKGGMPVYKYIMNRILTAIQNIMLNTKLSEFHTGYRAFSSEVLNKLPIHRNSDDFVFDNQILAQAIYAGYRIGEVSCPTRYFPEASSINFLKSVKYGFGVLYVALSFRLQKMGLKRDRIFESL